MTPGSSFIIKRNSTLINRLGCSCSYQERKAALKEVKVPLSLRKKPIPKSAYGKKAQLPDWTIEGVRSSHPSLTPSPSINRKRKGTGLDTKSTLARLNSGSEALLSLSKGNKTRKEGRKQATLLIMKQLSSRLARQDPTTTTVLTKNPVTGIG